jgi:hypothetical protein
MVCSVFQCASSKTAQGSWLHWGGVLEAQRHVALQAAAMRHGKSRFSHSVKRVTPVVLYTAA